MSRPDHDAHPTPATPGDDGDSAAVVQNGWTLYMHPLFLDEYERLERQVETLRRKDPVGYTRKSAAKRFAAITRLVYTIIPEDPTRAEYRQGDTLGADYKHWFRAKFFQQYRLFFRYRADSRIIIFVWVNNEDTLRAYGSADDAYRTFSGMLDSGHPPDDWGELLKAAKEEAPRMALVTVGQGQPDGGPDQGP